ncbi:MAG TPA: glycosyltransferase [Chthoniobacterales bacterium]|jgi:glycosyltransferase involved in cell wall biosynthesis
MKILIDHQAPFLLAHGGVQNQIEQTKSALERRGLDVEFVRWWDDRQQGTLIHSFGIPSRQYLDLARRNNLPVLVTSVFSQTCNRSDTFLKAQGLIVQSLIRMPGWGSIKRQLSWESYARVDCNLVGLFAEKAVLQNVYGVGEDRIQVVPLGLSEQFLNLPPAAAKEDYLITTGTITPAKRAVELAGLAKSAQVPILFVGKPIHDLDPYWKQFQSLIDARFVRYQPHVEDVGTLITLLQKARGFVLYSEYENWSLAAHEAAACGLPLLLPDLKWARERFGNGARYFPGNDSRANAASLVDFNRNAETTPSPNIKVWSWDEVAANLASIYETVSRSGRSKAIGADQR